MFQRPLLALSLVLSLGACSSSDAPSTASEAGGGGATSSASSASSAGGGETRDDGGSAPTGCSEVGLELIDLVNDYRQDNGLARIPASSSLCTVASAHTRDLADHRPHDASGCNLHSWSDEGDWEGCCYTSDHANAACMWNKPGQITSYPGIGYENSAAGVSTAASALAGWQTSPGHNQVILNQGGWASRTWRAVGADVHGGFAHLWFGEATDPAD